MHLRQFLFATNWIFLAASFQCLEFFLPILNIFFCSFENTVCPPGGFGGPDRPVSKSGRQEDPGYRDPMSSPVATVTEPVFYPCETGCRVFSHPPTGSLGRVNSVEDRSFPLVSLWFVFPALMHRSAPTLRRTSSSCLEESSSTDRRCWSITGERLYSCRWVQILTRTVLFHVPAGLKSLVLLPLITGLLVQRSLLLQHKEELLGQIRDSQPSPPTLLPPGRGRPPACNVSTFVPSVLSPPAGGISPFPLKPFED